LKAATSAADLGILDKALPTKPSPSNPAATKFTHILIPAFCPRQRLLKKISHMMH
jgi:hypothetical protein